MELGAVSAVAGTIITICIKLNCQPGCPVPSTALTFSRGERERMITGLVMSPLSPGSLYTRDNPPGIKLNMETVNNAWCEDLPNISNLG